MSTARDNVAVQDSHQIDAFLRHLTVTGRSPGTVSTYSYGLRAAAAAMPAGLAGAYPEEIEEWLAGYSNPSTRSTYYSALSSFYTWCVRKRRLKTNPAAEIEPPRRPRRLPRPVVHEQLQTILSQARQPIRLWSLIAAYAGARCIEISRLGRDDITETVTYLYGKGDKPRAVPTHPEVWRATRDLPPGPVAPHSAHYISERCSEEYRRLGLRGVTAHRLRHWSATWALVASGGNLRAVQEFLGHSSPAITQLYTAVSDSAMRSAVVGLPTFETATAASAAA